MLEILKRLGYLSVVVGAVVCHLDKDFSAKVLLAAWRAEGALCLSVEQKAWIPSLAELVLEEVHGLFGFP